MRTQLICGNWKMNNASAQTAALIADLRAKLDKVTGVEIGGAADVDEAVVAVVDAVDPRGVQDAAFAGASSASTSERLYR